MPIEIGDKYSITRFDGGLVTRQPAHLLHDFESPDAQNFDPSYVGGVKKRLGYIKFTSAAKSSPTGTFVSGLFGAAVSGGTVYVLATEGTALHNIAAGTWPAAIAGATITVDTMVSMCMFNDLFIIANTGGGPYKWTGSGDAAALGGTPPPNAKYVTVHRSRVWAAGPGYDHAAAASQASRVNFSKLNDPENWTAADDAGSININPNDGAVVNGICSGKDFLVVSKAAPSSGGLEGNLYVISGSSTFDFSVAKVASMPAVSHRAMVAYDGWVAVATSRGIYGVHRNGVFRIDDSIQKDYIDIPNKGTICAGRYRNTLRFSYPVSGTSNNREFVFDVERGVWARNTGKTIRIYANHPDGRLLSGTASTSILVWEEENGNTDDGAAINFYWETPDLDFGDPERQKRLVAFYLHAKNTGSYNITCNEYVDGTAAGSSQTMAVATEGPIKRFPSTHMTLGNFHRLRFTSNSASEPIEIYRVIAYAEKLQAVK